MENLSLAFGWWRWAELFPILHRSLMINSQLKTQRDDSADTRFVQTFFPQTLSTRGEREKEREIFICSMKVILCLPASQRGRDSGGFLHFLPTSSAHILPSSAHQTPLVLLITPSHDARLVQVSCDCRSIGFPSPQRHYLLGGQFENVPIISAGKVGLQLENGNNELSTHLEHFPIFHLPPPLLRPSRK